MRQAHSREPAGSKLALLKLVGPDRQTDRRRFAMSARENELSINESLYDFNLLVSCFWWADRWAKGEIINVLRMLGDDKPLVKRTPARGIIGVRTTLQPRRVTKELRSLFEQNPLLFRVTSKWVPVDTWTYSKIESLMEAVVRLRERIKVGEKWRMTVEKRRYTQHHTFEIIEMLAELISEKVDLRKPDKILRVDIMGGYAALSVLAPDEIFSPTKLPT